MTPQSHREPTHVSTDQAVAPEAPAGVSRRSALAQSLQFAEFAALTVPSVIFAWSASPEHGSTSPLTRYPKTDSVCTLEDGSTFQNLGVRHSESFLSQYTRHFDAALAGANVIAIECSADLIRQEPFFRAIADRALRQNKTVYLIDNQKTALAAAQVLGSPAASLAGALGLAYAYNKTGTDGQEIPRRSFMKVASRIIGWTGLLSSPTAPASAAAIAAGVYPYWDISFSTDCRTVAMLRDIREIVQKHQGETVLSVTGDVHARAFQGYANHSTLAGIKLRAYDAVYNSWLRSPYSLLRPEDLNLKPGRPA